MRGCSSTFWGARLFHGPLLHTRPALPRSWGQQRHGAMTRCWGPVCPGARQQEEGAEGSPQASCVGTHFLPYSPLTLQTQESCWPDISTQAALDVPTTHESLRLMHSLQPLSHPTSQQHSMPLPLRGLCPRLRQPSLLRLLPVPVGMSALSFADLSCSARFGGPRSCCLPSITDSWVTSSIRMVSYAI